MCAMRVPDMFHSSNIKHCDYTMDPIESCCFNSWELILVNDTILSSGSVSIQCRYIGQASKVSLFRKGVT